MDFPLLIWAMVGEEDLVLPFMTGANKAWYNNVKKLLHHKESLQEDKVRYSL